MIYNNCGLDHSIQLLNQFQLESYSTHKADILAIAVSDDEKSLFCSGLDPVIMNFIKVNNNTGKQTEAQWVKNVQRNIHEHDVRYCYLNYSRCHLAWP